MTENKMTKQPFPRWLYAILTNGGLTASGIYIGIISAEGFSNLRLAQVVVFGILGLLMFWGSKH